MRLLGVTISGFRNVGETTMDLSGITMLVAANNYGKSNLLDAIAFGVDFLNESPHGRSAMMATATCIPLVSALAQADFHFRVKFEDPGLGEDRFVRYGFSFSWCRGDGGGHKITSEVIELSSRLDDGWTTYIQRAEGRLMVMGRHGRGTFRSLRLDDNQLAIDVLGAIAGGEMALVVGDIKRIGFTLCPSAGESRRQWRTLSRLGHDVGDNICAEVSVGDLPQVLYDLKVNHEAHYDDLLAAIRTLFPEFVDISVRRCQLRRAGLETVDGHLQVRVGVGGGDDVPFRIRDERYRMTIRCTSLNQPADVAMMSAGTRHVIQLLATIAAVRQRPGALLVGIEGPESSVAPSLLGRLLELLGERCEDVSLLITSHTPLPTHHIESKHVYFGKPDGAGVARFRRVSDDEVENISSYACDRGAGFAEQHSELRSSVDNDAAMSSCVLEA